MNKSDIMINIIKCKEWCGICHKKTDTFKIEMSSDGHHWNSIILCKSCIKKLIIKLVKNTM